MDNYAKSDHEVERVQLQEDIERLQDTLQVHSDDEYMYDSDDDYLLIDLEHGEDRDLNVAESGDISTRSSFDGKSPYTVQGSATPVDDVYSTLEHLKKLGGEDLPVCVESGLALNRAYQEVILNSLHNIQDALAQNRQKQAALEEEMEGGAPTKGTKTKRTLRTFMVPFFKDSSGSFPQSNADVQIKQKGIMEPKVDPMSLIQWHGTHKKKLIQGIKRDCLEKAMKPLMAKRESLEIQRKKCKGKKEDKEIVKEILAIDSQINSIKKLPLSELIDYVDENTIDWMKIAILDLSGNRSFEACKLMWHNVLHPNINRSSWKKVEEKELTKLVHTHNAKNWESIAKQLGTNRSPFQCLQHYQVNLSKDNRGKSSWTPEEDAILKEVVLETKATGFRLIWDSVAIYIEGRSAIQCMCRWYQIDPSLHRGAWSEQEDAMLITAVELMGRSDWAKIQQLVVTRSPGQCRERYCNCLDPRINPGPWEYEEDKQLLLLVEKYGQGKWANVVKELDGRTDNQALQRYNRLIKWKRLTEWFDALPESTKKAMLGKSLTAKRFKEMEKLTWEKFQTQMGVFKEDYKKQQQDHAKGELVVPRPPCVLGYTKSSAAATKIWKRREALQKLITLHVKKIRSQQMYRNRDPKELAKMVTSMCSNDVQDQVAGQIVNCLPGSVTVKSLITLSRKMNRCSRKPGIKKLSAGSTSDRGKVNEALRNIVQILSAPINRKTHRYGRARKYFRFSKPISYEEDQKISVTAMMIYCKALGIDADQILKTAAHIANGQKKSEGQANFDVTRDVSILTSICYSVQNCDPEEPKENDEGATSSFIVDDEEECGDGDKSDEDKDVGVTQSSDCIATPAHKMRNKQEIIVIEDDVETPAGNSTKESRSSVLTENTETGTTDNTCQVGVTEKNTSVIKQINAKDSLTGQNTQIETIVIDENEEDKNTGTNAISTVDTTQHEVLVTNTEIAKVPDVNSSAKGSVIILSSVNKGDDRTQTECVDDSHTGHKTKQLNKHVIVANSIQLSPQAHKTSDGFQKPFFPRKTMKLQINWGLMPRAGSDGVRKVPQRLLPTKPKPINATPLSKRLSATATVVSSIESSSNNSAKHPEMGKITCKTLPPNVSTLRGFQTLLAKQKEMTLSANTYYTCCQKKQDESNQSSQKQNVDHLQGIRKTKKYQRLKARFEAMFMWPAFMASVSLPNVEDTAEEAEGNSEVVATPKKRGRKRKAQSKKKKVENMSDQEENEDGSPRKRWGRPTGAKNNCKRAAYPVRTSGRTRTQNKVYTEGINRARNPGGKYQFEKCVFNAAKRNTVNKLMEEYVRNKSLNQLQQTASVTSTDADCPYSADNGGYELMDIETSSTDAGHNLMEVEDKQVTTSFHQPSQQVSEMTDINETTSCVNNEGMNSTEAKSETAVPVMTVSANSQDSVPFHTLNINSATPSTQSADGLIPMILSFDKDAHGNIIQTLRPLTDLSQLPSNGLESVSEASTVTPSSNQNLTAASSDSQNSKGISTDT